MQTAPPTNPISSTIKRAKSSKSKIHITALEYLARTFPQHSQNIETIKPFARPPWWEPTHIINIPLSKDIAKHMHNENAFNESNTTLFIYTDGSGIEGQIGAVAYSPQLSQTKHLYLGTDKQSNVYTAE